MKTIILKTASNYLLPVLLLFSVFILLRGHYLPGGGFVGGLVASIAFVLHAFANGLDKTREFLKYHPGINIPIGLTISLISGFAPMLIGQPFMTGLWFEKPFPVVGMIGSALFFDIGVYIVVVGVTLTILFTISETANE
ncbi:Na+/H+ antiporter subunit B [Aridibaculum aurantiacum]|uniref:Na+/H+ antiporter subunit B n=1 Tax=Aridibaculum aurantiacum TaxID=2810307 RepID=UPI001A972207|nr:Na+/H+ antiporter subunit B [Aridibaculum aurantiacum]